MSHRPVSSTATAERNPTAAAVAAAGLIALAIAMGIGRFAFTPLLPMMQEDAALTVADGGWLASANYLGYLLGALSAMALRIGPPTMIRAGLVLVAAATFAMGLSRDFAVWAVWRALAGVASAWVLVYLSAWSLEHLAALGRPRLNGVVFSGVGAGIALAGALCLTLMRFGVGSSHAWMAFGLLALMLTVAVWRRFRPLPHANPRATAAAPPHWDRDAIRLVLCYAAFGFGYIIPATFLPAMAKQIVFDPAVFGWAWPIFGVAALASTLAAGLLRRWIGLRRLWIAGHALMAVGVALPVIAAGIVPIMLAALLVGGTFVVVTMVAIQEAREVGGEHATALIAAMTTGFAIGQIAGPLCAGYAVAATGNFAGALIVACAFLGVSAWALARGAASAHPG